MRWKNGSFLEVDGDYEEGKDTPSIRYVAGPLPHTSAQPEHGYVEYGFRLHNLRNIYWVYISVIAHS